MINVDLYGCLHDFLLPNIKSFVLETKKNFSLPSSFWYLSEKFSKKQLNYVAFVANSIKHRQPPYIAPFSDF